MFVLVYDDNSVFTADRANDAARHIHQARDIGELDPVVYTPVNGELRKVTVNYKQGPFAEDDYARGEYEFSYPGGEQYGYVKIDGRA